MKNMKKDVKIIHCDNSGKNKTFEENSAKTFEEINFELISPGTPQKVCVVEPEFATLYSQIHAMMAHVGLHENLKTGIWPKRAATTTKLENIMVDPHKEKCAHEKSYNKIPDYAKYLSTLG